MVKPKVAVLRTSPASVVDDYRRAMKLAEIDKFIDSGKTTILKDNISWHYPFPGANTTPWQMEGSILGLKDAGNQNIVCVQNETVVTRAEKGERLNKYDVVLKKYGVPVLYNFRDANMKWIKFTPKAKMRVLDKIFPKGIIIPDYFFGKNILHQPTMKCHIYTTTTGAMKNAFGGLLNRSRHYTHSVIHETLCDLLDIQKEIHTGIFAVMDGTTAGNGPGPRTMIPVEKDVILAGADQVAIDAVAASMMGFNPMDIGYIHIAHNSGLGVGKLDEIEIVGNPEVAEERWGFHVGQNFAARYGGHPLWYGWGRHIQKVFFQTPLVYLFIMGSFIYHDMVHWPVKGSRIYEEWLRESKWGKLFKEY